MTTAKAIRLLGRQEVFDPIGRANELLELEFWTRVEFVLGNPLDAKIPCWRWTGQTIKRLDRDGFDYGLFHPHRGYKVLAHRFSYAYFWGPFDNSLTILHKCDNPRCVNPLHLQLGTQRDNILDAYSKGRMRQATGHVRREVCRKGHVLTDDAVWNETMQGKDGPYIYRRCIACATENQRRRYATRKVATCQTEQ